MTKNRCTHQKGLKVAKFKSVHPLTTTESYRIKVQIILFCFLSDFVQLVMIKYRKVRRPRGEGQTFVEIDQNVFWRIFRHHLTILTTVTPLRLPPPKGEG